MSNETLIHSFTKRRSRLAQFARRLLGNDDEAEDVLQEAFCRLWPRAETLETDDDADRMAITTVKNLSIDVLRERQIHATSPIEGLADGPPDDDAPSTARQLALVERIAHQHLTPQQWRIFRSHDIEGLGYDVIASQEQMLEASVRKHVSRARMTIRKIYNQYNNEP